MNINNINVPINIGSVQYDGFVEDFVEPDESFDRRIPLPYNTPKKVSFANDTTPPTPILKKNTNKPSKIVKGLQPKISPSLYVSTQDEEDLDEFFDAQDSNAPEASGKAVQEVPKMDEITKNVSKLDFTNKDLAMIYNVFENTVDNKEKLEGIYIQNTSIMENVRERPSVNNPSDSYNDEVHKKHVTVNSFIWETSYDALHVSLPEWINKIWTMHEKYENNSTENLLVTKHGVLRITMNAGKIPEDVMIQVKYAFVKGITTVLKLKTYFGFENMDTVFEFIDFYNSKLFISDMDFIPYPKEPVQIPKKEIKGDQPKRKVRFIERSKLCQQFEVHPATQLFLGKHSSKDPQKRKLSTFLNYKDKILMETNDYISIMFPIDIIDVRFPSALIMTKSVLQDAITCPQYKKVIEGMKLAFKRMLKFYGLQIYAEDKDDMQIYEKNVLPRDHFWKVNQKYDYQIKRILRSLQVFQLLSYSEAFREYLEKTVPHKKYRM